jgi:N4-gp56 family major capsid protein
MATMTPTTGAVFIPEIWAKDIQMARTNNLVMSNLVDHQYENGLSYGDTVHITAIAEMTADAMTPGTALVPVAPTETEQTLVIDQYYGKAIEIQDVLKRQSKYELRRPYTEVMGRSIATAMDSSLLNQYANVLTANKMTSIATMTFAQLVDAHTLLDAVNVPMDGRALVINSVILGDLRKLAEFTSYDSTGRDGVREREMGIVGTIYGTKVYLSNAVKTASSAYQALLFHKAAFAMAIQMQPDTESDRDILKKTDLLSTSALWGVKTVRPDHAVVIRRNV